MQTGLAVAVGAILGVFLTMIGTGIHAGELLALQRQAAAIESIAETFRIGSGSVTPTTPSLSVPGAHPMVFEDSSGNDRCTIVEVVDGSYRIEGDEPALCESFLENHPWFPDLAVPD